MSSVVVNCSGIGQSSRVRGVRKASLCPETNKAAASHFRWRSRIKPKQGPGKTLVMHLLPRAAIFAAALVYWAIGSTSVQSAPPIALHTDGSLQIAGRKLRCGNVRNMLDPRLPNLGISVPERKLLVINPALIARQPKIVQLFVFYHECGHHHVGPNELEADCWAVRRGVEEAWLDRLGLEQVCKSFENSAATPTHPAGARRCKSLDGCFVAAEVGKAVDGQKSAGTEAQQPVAAVPR